MNSWWLHHVGLCNRTLPLHGWLDSTRLDLTQLYATLLFWFYIGQMLWIVLGTILVSPPQGELRRKQKLTWKHCRPPTGRSATIATISQVFRRNYFSPCRETRTAFLWYPPCVSVISQRFMAVLCCITITTSYTEELLYLQWKTKYLVPKVSTVSK